MSFIHLVSIRGRRDRNEDRHQVLRESEDVLHAAVYDGHGGDFVSNFLKNGFLDDIVYSGKRIKDVVRSYGKKLLMKEKAEECGSTAAVVTIDTKRKKIRTMNIGDSRIVLYHGGGRVEALTNDHKPDTEEERVRISSMGETISYDREDELYRINGYSVSRAFGDTNYPAVATTPDVAHHRYKTGRFVIVACDGVWDVLSNEDACRVVSDAGRRLSGRVEPYNDDPMSKHNLATHLMREALRKGSQDNITAMVIGI